MYFIGGVFQCYNKISDQSNLREEDLIWVESLKFQFITVGKAWWKEGEAVDYPTFTVTKQGKMNTGA